MTRYEKIEDLWKPKKKTSRDPGLHTFPLLHRRWKHLLIDFFKLWKTWWLFLVFIFCKILPRYQERSTDLSKFMSDLCHVRCGSLKEELPGREEMLRNEFNRSKCWMLNVTNITKHKLFTNDSWSIAAIGRGRHGFRCIIAREDPLTRFDWHLTQIQRFSTRLTIFEPRSPERTPNKRNKHWKKHGMTTSREHIDGVALNIVESQPVLRIEVGEERLKKVTTEKLTPHCLEQQPLAALHINPYIGFSRFAVLQWAWTSWCDLEEVMHLFLKHSRKNVKKSWRITLRMLQSYWKLQKKTYVNVGIDLKRKMTLGFCL